MKKDIIASTVILLVLTSYAQAGVPEKSRHFQNVESGYCLSLRKSNIRNGVELVQDTCDANDKRQKFSPKKVGKKFKLMNFHQIRWNNSGSRYCVDVHAKSEFSGAKTHMWTCHWGKNQTFDFRPGKQVGTYLLQARHSDLCLSPEKENYDRQNQRIKQFKCVRSKLHSWKLIKY